MTKPDEGGIAELFWRAIERKNRAIGAQVSWRGLARNCHSIAQPTLRFSVAYDPA